MILVFGGTTEGRAALKVLETAGSLFFYSTLGDNQQVELINGKRVTGGMNGDEIRGFCLDNDIKLIVDAAHPFAEILHKNIFTASESLEIPVIRYERIYSERNKEFIWCASYPDMIDKLLKDDRKQVLALTGVNTIPKLRKFWEKRHTVFRILNRQESLNKALNEGVNEQNIVFFENGESDLELMQRLHPDAVLTKESGDSGFFEDKVYAAELMKIPLYVIARPDITYNSYIVNGENSFRFRVERLVPGFFPLRTGITTGTCATAASKAASLYLLEGIKSDKVSIKLPSGEDIEIDVDNVEIVVEDGKKYIVASVIKDAGDDPDVINGRKIYAKVCIGDKGISLFGGEGVGIVTLPGLGIPIGAPAINNTPRMMIENELTDIIHRNSICGLDVIISVEAGVKLAASTFNPKLGIMGGVSIIGTSGIVRPFSTEAFLMSIKKEIEIAKAVGCDTLVINSGAKSEKLLKVKYPSFPPQAFVHYGNFVGETLRMADEIGFDDIVIGVMIGKAVKLAAGNLDTHSKKVVMDKEFIKSIAISAKLPTDKIRFIDEINTARELIKLFKDYPSFFDRLEELCKYHCNKVISKSKLSLNLILE